MIKSAFFNIEGDETEEWNACLCISIESDSDGRFLREIIIPITSLGGRNRGGDPMLNREVGAFSHGCLMVNLEPSIAAAVIQFGNERIADGNLAEFGREASPHVTVLYGFSPDVPAADVLAAYQGPATVRFGPVARFSPPGKDYDVLHLTVESPELEAEHQRLRDLFGDEVAPSDYGDYKPHVTLAYVKPGTHPELDGNDEFATKDLVGIGSLSYSQPDGGKAERLLNSGTPCGDSFIAPDKTCHAGQGDKLAVDVPETARMAAVTFKAKDASGTQRTFMVVASKNTRAGARFAYEQNPEAVLAEHQKTFPIPEVEKTFRATLLEVVDEIPRAMFHNSYDSIKDAASRGFDEMLHFAKQVGKMVGGVDERDVQLKNRGEFSFYELMAACDGPVALANSGKPCGESFIADGDTCHVGVTPEQDSAYAGAVAAGDTATAQKMVDAAAKAAGYNYGPLWHATNKGDFSVFEQQPIGFTGGKGSFGHFGTKEQAEKIHKNSEEFAKWANIQPGATEENKIRPSLRSFYIKALKVKKVADDIYGPMWGILADTARRGGYDALAYENKVEGKGESLIPLVSPSQIKSADPITRDESGNVIPLSKRFDKASSKISNSGEFEESLHPRANDGKFAPKEGGGLKEMAESNPQAKAAVSILGEIERQFPGTKPLIVGGAVRDMVMGKTPKDFDIATPLPAAKLQAAFRSHEIGNSADFGIVAIPHEGHTFEVAQFRTDGAYSDQRRPDSVTAAGSFDEDSKRRDFTINAMAMDSAGNLVDPQGGKADIEAKVIRAVGDPEARFTEDPLRMIRAARFAGRLGFDIETKTMDAMKKLAPSVATLSGERIRDEVFKAADNGKSLAKFVSVMSEAGLLEHTLPEVAAMRGLPHNPKHHPEGGVYEHVLEAVKASNTTDATTNVAILLHDIGKATTRGEKDGQPTYIAHEAAGIPLLEKAAARLKFSNEQKEAIALAVEHHMVGHNFDAVSDRLALRFRQEKNWPLLREVMRSDEASRGALFKAEDFEKKMGRADRLVEQFGKKEEMEKRLSAVFTGKDIMSAAPKLKGAHIGAVKTAVRDWVLEKNFEVTPEQVRAKILEESEAMKNRADEPDEHPELALTPQQS